MSPFILPFLLGAVCAEFQTLLYKDLPGCPPIHLPLAAMRRTWHLRVGPLPGCPSRWNAQRVSDSWVSNEAGALHLQLNLLKTPRFSTH